MPCSTKSLLRKALAGSQARVTSSINPLTGCGDITPTWPLKEQPEDALQQGAMVQIREWIKCIKSIYLWASCGRGGEAVVCKPMLWLLAPMVKGKWVRSPALPRVCECVCVQMTNECKWQYTRLIVAAPLLYRVIALNYHVITMGTRSHTYLGYNCRSALSHLVLITVWCGKKASVEFALTKLLCEMPWRHRDLWRDAVVGHLTCIPARTDPSSHGWRTKSFCRTGVKDRGNVICE